MGFFGLDQRLEPIRDFIKAFFAGGFHHFGIHFREFIRFTGDGGLQILIGVADGQSGDRVAHMFKKLQVSMGVPGLAFGG